MHIGGSEIKRIECCRIKGIIFTQFVKIEVWNSATNQSAFSKCYILGYPLQIWNSKASVYDFSFLCQPISLRNTGMGEPAIVMIVWKIIFSKFSQFMFYWKNVENLKLPSQPFAVFPCLLYFLSAPFHQEMLVYVLDNRVQMKKNISLVFSPLAVTAD